jgi:hypothetical protein
MNCVPSQRVDLNGRRFGRVRTLNIVSQIPGGGQSSLGTNSVSLKKRYREKESASDAQQSTCEFRPLLRRQALYPTELRAHYFDSKIFLPRAHSFLEQLFSAPMVDAHSRRCCELR